MRQRIDYKNGQFNKSKQPTLKKFLPTLLLIFIAATISSCCKTKPCRPFEQLYLDFSGFDLGELNVVILKTYEKEKEFARSARVDSLAVKQGVNMQVDVRYDGANNSFTISSRDNKLVLSSRYDYVVEVPSASRRWQIDQLEDVQEEKKFCRPSGFAKNYCNNTQFRTYRINGIVGTRTGSLPALTP